MLKPTAQYNEASTLLERLLIKDFSLIEEMYCDEIADQLYEDFMKDRKEQDGCCLVNDVEKIKQNLLTHHSQILVLTRAINDIKATLEKTKDSATKENQPKQNQKEFEECLMRLAKGLGL